jgi:hypothetical protein
MGSRRPTLDSIPLAAPPDKLASFTTIMAITTIPLAIISRPLRRPVITK